MSGDPRPRRQQLEDAYAERSADVDAYMRDGDLKMATFALQIRRAFQVQLEQLFNEPTLAEYRQQLAGAREELALAQRLGDDGDRDRAEFWILIFESQLEAAEARERENADAA